MAFVLGLLLGEGRLRGHHLQIYLIAYGVYRFLTEFIRPEPIWAGGLTFYQWASYGHLILKSAEQLRHPSQLISAVEMFGPNLSLARRIHMIANHRKPARALRALGSLLVLLLIAVGPIAGAWVWAYGLLNDPVEGVVSSRTGTEGRYAITDLRVWSVANQKPTPSGDGRTMEVVSAIYRFPRNHKSARGYKNSFGANSNKVTWTPGSGLRPARDAIR